MPSIDDTNRGGPITAFMDDDLTLFTLTPVQQMFVKGVVSGNSLVESYLAGHPKCSRDSAYVGGSRMIRLVKIKQAIDELYRQESYDVIRLLRSGREAAVRTVLKASNKPDSVPPDQLRAALEILDRTGISSRHIARLELTDERDDGFDNFMANCTRS